MLDFAYAPYSDYQVGACILTDDGGIFTGCNVENASYGATICAERAAVCAMVSAGTRRIRKIAIAGRSGTAWPCGICRQILNEFQGADGVMVICESPDSDIVSIPLSELLPHAFGRAALNGDAGDY